MVNRVPSDGRVLSATLPPSLLAISPTTLSPTPRPESASASSLLESRFVSKRLMILPGDVCSDLSASIKPAVFAFSVSLSKSMPLPSSSQIRRPLAARSRMCAGSGRL